MTELSTLTVSRHRTVRPRDDVIIRRRDLRPGDAFSVEELPITTPLRTCIDIAALLDQPAAVITLDSALESSRVKPHHLAAVALKGRGAAKIRGAFDVSDGRSQSIPETRLRLWLSSDPRIGRVVPQMRLRQRGHPYDLGLPELRAVVEYQSWQFHQTRAVWVKDARWCNEAYAVGWGYLQLTHEDILRGRAHVINLVLGGR